MKMLPSNETSTLSCADGSDEDPSMLQSTSSSTTRLPSQFVPPSESSGRPWYHGEISQTEAEVLLDVAQPGRFLVRKAGPTRYFLSCVTDNHILLHLPIHQLGRYFYLNAGKFATLAEAVQHHCEMVDTAKPVSNQNSISSPSIASTPRNSVQLQRYLALSKSSDQAGSNELSASRGDVITKLHVMEGPFILAKNENTAQTGYLPVKVLVPILTESLCVQELPYFHTTLTADALKMLTCVGAGAFLVRLSSQGADAFALLVNTRNKIEKFLIRGAADGKDGFLLAGRHFRSLQHIIDRYCVHPIASDVRLTHAVLPPQTSTHQEQEESDCAQSVALTTPECSPNVTSIEATDDYVNHNCASQTVATVQALRKSREEKAWKSCWLTLCDDPSGGCELIISDTETSVKARLALDLAYCVMYLLDDSVFTREGCLYLCQTEMDQFSGVYLCFRPTHVLIKWLELLRPRVLGLRSSAVPVMVSLQFESPKQSHIAMLHLQLDKYRSESVKPDGYYSAYGMVNGVKVCSTQVIMATVSKGALPSVIFDCSFLLPLIPSENGFLQFSILSHPGGGKKSRPLAVSALFPLPASRPLSDQTESGLSFRATRFRIRILTEEKYAPLLNYLKDGAADLLEWASDALSIQQRSLLCWSIVSLLLPHRDELFKFISRMLRRVLATCTAENVMRQDSLTTTLLTQALRIGARSQLEDALDAAGVTSLKVLQPTDVDNVTEILEKLVSSNPLVNDLLVVVAGLASERFPDEPHLLRRVLSNVYILRFVNPLLIAYMSGNLINQQLAKGVQTAANIAASASPRLEDVTAGSQCLRALFERLRSANSETSSNSYNENNVEPRCCDWMAIICHLLQVVLTSREGAPQVEPILLQLIHAHESSFS